MSASALRHAAALGVALLALSTSLAEGAGLGMPVPHHTNLLAKPVRSYVELRFEDVVKQSRDLSCGAAALATLLRHYYDEAVDETEVIDAAFQIGNEDQIRRDGFSMLELKRVGEKRGYIAQGFEIKDVDSLRKLKVPALTLINTRGYEHFVVLKGIEGDKVLIADPAFGNRTWGLESFEGAWRNVILVFLSTSRGGRDAFVDDLTPKARTTDIIPLLDRTLVTIGRGAGEF